MPNRDEEWRAVPGWPGYEASSEGRVRSVDRVLPVSGQGRPSRDNRGGAACILATYAVAAGALAVVYAAVNPLPATQIRDLVSPPAASASVPTRPLSVLPGVGAGLELVRIPRGLDVHTVPWSTGAAHRPVHLNFEGGDSSAGSQPRVHRGHHAPVLRPVHRGRHEDAGRAQRLHHPERSSGRHHSGDDSGRHHRADGHIGGHHQGAHSQGGHHRAGGRHG